VWPAVAHVASIPWSAVISALSSNSAGVSDPDEFPQVPTSLLSSRTTQEKITLLIDQLAMIYMKISQL